MTNDIEHLNQEKQQLETILNSGEATIEELTKTSNRIGEILSELDEKEMRWLELDELINFSTVSNRD